MYECRGIWPKYFYVRGEELSENKYARDNASSNDKVHRRSMIVRKLMICWNTLCTEITHQCV